MMDKAAALSQTDFARGPVVSWLDLQVGKGGGRQSFFLSCQANPSTSSRDGDDPGSAGQTSRRSDAVQRSSSRRIDDGSLRVGTEREGGKARGRTHAGAPRASSRTATSGETSSDVGRAHLASSGTPSVSTDYGTSLSGELIGRPQGLCQKCGHHQRPFVGKRRLTSFMLALPRIWNGARKVSLCPREEPGLEETHDDSSISQLLNDESVPDGGLPKKRERSGGRVHPERGIGVVVCVSREASQC